MQERQAFLVLSKAAKTGDPLGGLPICDTRVREAGSGQD